MLEITIENDEKINFSNPTSSFRFHEPKIKKYMLHKMVTKEEKQAQSNYNQQSTKTDPQYFSRMLKEQKKNQFVSTFIKKLKYSIINNGTPPLEYEQIEAEEANHETEAIQLNLWLNLVFSWAICIQVTCLIIMVSFSLSFEEVLRHGFFQTVLILSLLFHILEIAKRILVKGLHSEKQNKDLSQKILHYLGSPKFAEDLTVTICFMASLLSTSLEQSLFLVLTRFFLLIKARSLMRHLEFVELSLIENEYREQIWSLVKVFIFNFAIAHILAIILVQIASLEHENNWIIKKGIQEEDWVSHYIWAYYWATTIMLTVGFGDIVPTNRQEALCMIFVETVSCIVLAYNINRLGAIISKIRSYDLEKNGNIKVFNQIVSKNDITKQVSNKITNYIKESTVIKRNYNIEEEQSFLKKLPETFKLELSEEMNRKIWRGMMFFQNLAEGTLLDLSRRIEKKLTHPDEFVYSSGSEIDIMIFNKGTFGYSYNRGVAGKCHGKIIQEFTVSGDSYKLASLDFLLGKTLPYDVKCIDYVIFYKLSLKDFKQILANHPFDYEYYFMIKDKDKHLINEYEVSKCPICKNERHTLFLCPKLHYIPLKQHIFTRYIKNLKKTIQSKVEDLLGKSLRKCKSRRFNCLAKMSLVKFDLFKKRLDIDNMKYQTSGISSQVQIETRKTIHSTMLKTYRDLLQREVTEKNEIEKAMDELRKNLKEEILDEALLKEVGVWDLECDTAHNFKFYDKAFNVEELSERCKKIKKKAKKSPFRE